LNLPALRKTMIVGTNVVNSGGRTNMGLNASVNPTITQYFSKVVSHELPKRE
jgi:hypothetical protein